MRERRARSTRAPREPRGGGALLVDRSRRARPTPRRPSTRRRRCAGASAARVSTPPPGARSGLVRDRPPMRAGAPRRAARRWRRELGHALGQLALADCELTAPLVGKAALLGDVGRERVGLRTGDRHAELFRLRRGLLFGGRANRPARLADELLRARGACARAPQRSASETQSSAAATSAATRAEGRHALDSRVGSPGMQRGRPTPRRAGAARVPRRRSGGLRQSLTRAVAQLELAVDRCNTAPDEAHVVGERALRERQEHGERPCEAGPDAELTRHRCVATDERETTPGEAEPRSEWKRPPRSSRLYARTRNSPTGTSSTQPGSNVTAPTSPMPQAAAIDAAASPTRTLSGMPVRNGRPRSSSSACALRCRRRGRTRRRPHRAVPMRRRSEAAADHDVGQVPSRVRQVQERDVVAPAARLGAYQDGLAEGTLTGVAPITTPPPGSSGVLRRPRCPPSDQSSSCRSVDRRPSRSGSTLRGSHRPRASRCAARQRAEGRRGHTAPTRGCRRADGTPNSSDATTPPGRTTRASSATVAPGSST